MGSSRTERSRSQTVANRRKDKTPERRVSMSSGSPRVTKTTSRPQKSLSTYSWRTQQCVKEKSGDDEMAVDLPGASHVDEVRDLLMEIGSARRLQERMYKNSCISARGERYQQAAVQRNACKVVEGCVAQMEESLTILCLCTSFRQLRLH
ncbi:hypothetical protein E8E14_008646 [Neopestalotiopsis sp. 37M]|nr:hypothetical protein E8E14_008646 [Neopestalotiopsis sp. 37M]